MTNDISTLGSFAHATKRYLIVANLVDGFRPEGSKVAPVSLPGSRIVRLSSHLVLRDWELCARNRAETPSETAHDTTRIFVLPC